MRVSIIDAEQNDKTIAVIAVNLRALQYIPQAQDYFDAAWAIAIDDGLVQQDHKSKYQFLFS